MKPVRSLVLTIKPGIKSKGKDIMELSDATASCGLVIDNVLDILRLIKKKRTSNGLVSKKLAIFQETVLYLICSSLLQIIISAKYFSRNDSIGNYYYFVFSIQGNTIS